MENKKNMAEIGEDLRQTESNYKKTIEPYRSVLWSYCYRLTGSPWDAEDLVQETLLKSLSLLSKVFQEMNIKAYLFRIATNIWIDQHRRRKAEIVDVYPMEMVQDPSGSIQFQTLENMEFLLKHLTPKQFAALLLTDVFLFKAEEAAEIIGTTRGAVYASLERGRSALKSIPKGQAQHTREHAVNLEPSNIVIERLLEGFRNKDAKAIASLLHEHTRTEIIHAGIEYGKEETKKNSLRDWEESAQRQGETVALYKTLWGRPVIAEMERREEDLFLTNIHSFEVEEGYVMNWRFYCFSWELMNLAAEGLKAGLNAKCFQNQY
ncbi:RNA polymerase sigma-70 factor, ECF subfamily [Bacillus sp. OV322]|uniref:sigma-70 family RNA polymerase sigma factor n=1 Tax=Bacillus sp. OV322 TaxID=1882764 RepID=UPI0008E02824|nr:RNA polymerase sigma factor [Bacillus sp. OV322]SFC92453.1 RNA polymerase sigma-70 factor, ECF subfamily [Bacillus sp. OV322]